MKSTVTNQVVWLVNGSCGEYSDHREWVVCAYKTEDEAQVHAERAQARSDELRRKYDACYDIPEGANEWDPQESRAYTGTRYDVSMVAIHTFA